MIVTSNLMAYNRLNKLHDHYYMFSDDGRVYRNGEREAKTLALLYQELSDDERDLAGLYNNYVLKRAPMSVKRLPDTLEEAMKYYPEIR